MSEHSITPLADMFIHFSGAALQYAGPVQCVEVRRAYFAGCFALRQLLKDAAERDPAVLVAVRQLIDTELAVWEATLGTCLEGKV